MEGLHSFFVPPSPVQICHSRYCQQAWGEEADNGERKEKTAVKFTLGKNISQSQQDHAERKSSVGEN